jgi:hypothetical protein
MSDSSDASSEIEDEVAGLLMAAGVQPSPEELAEIAAGHRARMDRIDRLYTVPAVRYEEPAIVFDPTPKFVEWDGVDPS